MANQGDLAAAKAEHAALVPLLETDKVLALDGADFPASTLLAIAEALVQGEIARASGDHRSSIGHFETAVAAQDELPYMEPPFWYYPTRQSLGAALLQAGDAVAAEAVYQRDLEAYPRNGWSLFGLVQSLESQGKDTEAADARARFEQVWSLADVTLTGSRL